MLVICLLLAAIGLIAYVSGDGLAISGANIAISIVTLLLLPILQATQNRDGAALQAKLDELIKTNAEARNALIGLENRSEAEIQRVRAEEEREARELEAPGAMADDMREGSERGLLKKR